MKKMFIKLVLFFALVALLILTAFYSGIVVRHYTLDSKLVKNGRGMRIALISDLHGYIYGDKQDVLIKKLAGQNPDLVVMAGDMVDKDTTLEATRLLCEGFKDLSPTVPIVYVVGNHESDLDDVDEIKNSIRKFGVTVLEDECLRFNLNGTNVLISGVQSPYISKVKKAYSSMKNKFAPSVVKNAYKVLVVHQPEHIEEYLQYDFDLILSGHTHGGQVRIPFMSNGLYAPNQGVFPKYAGGMYTHDDTTHIISRGLVIDEDIPRIFNPPEIVIIDVVAPD